MSSLTYKKVNGYNIPELALPPQPEGDIGKYGRARKEFLMNHRKAVFTNLLTSCTLTQHLIENEKTAWSRMEQIIQQMAEAQGVTEELKERDQMKWVGLMSNIRAKAEEIVMQELVYS